MEEVITTQERASRQPQVAQKTRRQGDRESQGPSIFKICEGLAFPQQRSPRGIFSDLP